MEKGSGTGHFTPDVFEFLRELDANNNREWFNRNKKRYLRVARDPMLRFIEDFGALLRSISPSFRADPKPTGGSLFRIYRDTRFSKDKRPYKTNLAAHFPHFGGKHVSAPGFYLSLQSGGAFMGGGIWHPDGTTLKRVRQAIVDRTDDWAKVRSRLEVEAESRLKRPPKGFDPEHPWIEDLKLKDFVTSESYNEEAVCSPSFILDYRAACERIGPLISFLCRGLGLPY